MPRYDKKLSRDKPIRYQHKKLGQFIIYTDTDQTEKNYFEGLKRNIPDEIRSQIDIIVKRADTPELVKSCISEARHAPNYARIAIVFDRDEVPDFDEIINSATSNPATSTQHYQLFSATIHTNFQLIHSNTHSKLELTYQPTHL